MAVYLDHAASSPMRPEVLDAMTPWFHDRHANPTAAHRAGRRARQALDDARATLADAIGFSTGDIVFTGGGTESDNLAIGRRRPPGTTVVSAIEHPAVLTPAELQDAHIVGVDAAGVLDLDALRDVLDDTTEVVSVMIVNNETGVVQPWSEIAEIVRALAPNAVLHTDAVQALAWLDLAEVVSDVDQMSITGHKLGGPQGVGASAIRSHSALEPLLVGGGQERDRRAGTQNVAGAVGFAKAVELTRSDRDERLRRVDSLAERLLGGLQAATSGVTPTVPRDLRVPGIVHLLVDGVDSEALLFLLDEADLACSAASSCASGAQGGSHVLAAMGLDTSDCAPLRLSLGWSTTETEVEAAIDLVSRSVATLRGSHG